MNKKQIALGMLAATFCAATMTSCGKYGPPERYSEYAQSTKKNEVQIKTQENDNDDIQEDVTNNKTKNIGSSSVISGEDDKRCNVYGPPEKHNEKVEINND